MTIRRRSSGPPHPRAGSRGTTFAHCFSRRCSRAPTISVYAASAPTASSRLVELGADHRDVPPDEAVARSELLEQMQKTANGWPKPEREAFELHFVEGFEPDEIGMVLGLSTKQANELLDNIRGRLRETLLAEAAGEQR